MASQLFNNPDALAAFCRRHHIRRLSLFGSVLRGTDRPDSDVDLLVQAVTVASEAASKVTAETRSELADLPWAVIVGMRNRLVHAYFDIDRDILWTTVTEAVPPVVESLATLLEPD